MVFHDEKFLFEKKTTELGYLYVKKVISLKHYNQISIKDVLLTSITQWEVLENGSYIFIGKRVRQAGDMQSIIIFNPNNKEKREIKLEINTDQVQPLRKNENLIAIFYNDLNVPEERLIIVDENLSIKAEKILKIQN